MVEREEGEKRESIHHLLKPRVSIYDECEQCRVDHERISGVYTWSVTIVGLWGGGGV